MVVKIATVQQSARANLAVGVESGGGEAGTELGEDGFDLFLDALAHDEAAADATDEHGETFGGGVERGGASGGFGADDEGVAAGFHEANVMALGDVAGERERLFGIVDGEDGADQAVFGVAAGEKMKWKKEAGGGKAGGAFAEVAFVEGERGLVVERVEDVSGGVSDETFGAERFPAAGGAVGDAEAIAIEADGDDAAGIERGAESDQRVAEDVAIAGEAAGDMNIGRKAGAKTGGEESAVDEEAVAENENVTECGRGEPAAEFCGGFEAFGRRADGNGFGANGGVLERDADGAEAVVGNVVAEDFARGAAAGAEGGGEMGDELGARAVGVCEHLSRAEIEHEIGGRGPGRARRRPTVVRRPPHGKGFHARWELDRLSGGILEIRCGCAAGWAEIEKVSE